MVPGISSVFFTVNSVYCTYTQIFENNLLTIFIKLLFFSRVDKTDHCDDVKSDLPRLLIALFPENEMYIFETNGI